jgi:serine/threonine protein kinase
MPTAAAASACSPHHQQGSIHSDLKLNNIIVDTDSGAIRAADPGLLRPIGHPSSCCSPCTPHLVQGRFPGLPASWFNVPGLDIQQLFLSLLIGCIGKNNMPAEINHLNGMSPEELVAAAGNYKGW